MATTIPIDFHHVKPLSHGGTDDDTNIITLYWTCHGHAHGVGRNMPAVDYRRLYDDEGIAKAKAAGVHIGRPRKLTPDQREEALRRRAAGETLAEIAKSYAVDVSMISRLKA